MTTDEIWKELENYFGTPIPNPHNYPQTFMWYLQLYKEIKSVRE